MVGHTRVAGDSVLKPCHEAYRVATQGDHPRAKLNDIQASIAPLALADVGLPLSKRLGELHLRHTGLCPRAAQLG